MNKVIFYYQTFKEVDQKLISLDNILYNDTPVTHIHVSSIHFGVDKNNKPYIHLNNRIPTNDYFDDVWETIEKAASKNIKIVLMIGGAGGGYSTLFSDFETYYKLLHDLLQEKKFINGVDLDIEENCDIKNIKILINRIVNDFGKDYIITVAPVQGSLSNDTPGIGGFCYKNLLNSEEGGHIDYINCQAYWNYSLYSLDSIVKNGYNVNQIVMGMISGEDFKQELEKMHNKYGSNFGGVFIWEYFNSIPNPKKWTETIKKILDI